MNDIVIGIGSNIRAREHIAKAQACLKKVFEVKAVSAWCWTKAIGDSDQDDYLNGAMRVATDMGPLSVAQTLKDIEIEIGRKKRARKYAPREIDLDILVWNDMVVDDDVHGRDFLRHAILELCPHMRFLEDDAMHPSSYHEKRLAFD